MSTPQQPAWGSPETGSPSGYPETEFTVVGFFDPPSNQTFFATYTTATAWGAECMAQQEFGNQGIPLYINDVLYVDVSGGVPQIKSARKVYATFLDPQAGVHGE